MTLTVTQTGDYGVSTGTKTVEIPTSGTKSYAVATTGDNTDEPNGSVTVTLNAGSGYTVSSSQGTASVSVADDDDPPPPPPPARPTVTVHAASGAESDYEIRFRVTLSEASTEKVTVSWLTLRASGSPNPAKGSYTGLGKGDDFVSAGGTLTFQPGQTVAYGEVWLVDDTVAEEDEYVLVWLDGANGADIAVDEATITITDDD